MTLNQSALLELTQMLRTADGGDLMRQMLGLMLQALVDAEATSVIGAEPQQRTEERTTQRNGTRLKTVSSAEVAQPRDCAVRCTASRCRGRPGRTAAPTRSRYASTSSFGGVPA